MEHSIDMTKLVKITESSDCGVTPATTTPSQLVSLRELPITWVMANGTSLQETKPPPQTLMASSRGTLRNLSLFQSQTKETKLALPVWTLPLTPTQLLGFT